MELKTWKKGPYGRIWASDVKVAKNYLENDEIKKLVQTISVFFDYIENIIENRETFTMEEFANSMVIILKFNEYKLLRDEGETSKLPAEKKALNEYHEFNKTQPIKWALPCTLKV